VKADARPFPQGQHTSWMCPWHNGDWRRVGLLLAKFWGLLYRHDWLKRPGKVADRAVMLEDTAFSG
jgi:hypothetical protein